MAEVFGVRNILYYQVLFSKIVQIQRDTVVVIACAEMVSSVVRR